MCSQAGAGTIYVSSSVSAWHTCLAEVQKAGWCPGQGSLDERSSPLRKYEKWLGHWKPEYNAFTKETEVVLQVSCALQTPCSTAIHYIHCGLQRPAHLPALIGAVCRMDAMPSGEVVSVADDGAA